MFESVVFRIGDGDTTESDNGRLSPLSVFACWLAVRWQRSGNALFTIEVEGRGRALGTMSRTWNVEGESDPATWVYRCDLGRTDPRQRTRRVEAAGVIHFKIRTAKFHAPGLAEGLPFKYRCGHRAA